MIRHSCTRALAIATAMVNSRGATRAGCLLWLLALFAAGPALADYIAEPGDVLEITVQGAPGLHRRAAIDAVGHLSMPILGDVEAAGKSLSQVKAILRKLLIAKNIMREPEVTVEVGEYRPVYVGGDVVKPGAYPYRPGMTARDAVALAEGYDLLHLRGRDPMLEAADARGDYDTYAVEFAKQTARIARLKAELSGGPGVDLKALGNLPVEPSVLAEIIQFENQQLAADREDRDREKASLGRMIKQTQDQLAALQHEQQEGANARDQQQKNLARAREMMQRGLLAMARLEDNQRAFAAAQNQLFDTQARAAQAQKDLEDLTRKLQTTDDQRHIQLLQELRDAVTQSATARYRLDAATEKVRYTAGGGLRGEPAAAHDPPEVTIYRLVNGVQQKSRANEGTMLNPGDNVEIATKLRLGKLLNGAVTNHRLPIATASSPPALQDSHR